MRVGVALQSIRDFAETVESSAGQSGSGSLHVMEGAEGEDEGDGTWG